MTEQEAIETIEKAIEYSENSLAELDTAKKWSENNGKLGEYYSIRENVVKEIDASKIAIKALEKQIPKKPIEKVMPYSEEVGFNSEWHCPCCDSYIGYFTEGMSEPEQMGYCNNCGQHIAKDWSDTD